MSKAYQKYPSGPSARTSSCHSSCPLCVRQYCRYPPCTRRPRQYDGRSFLFHQKKLFQRPYLPYSWLLRQIFPLPPGNWDIHWYERRLSSSDPPVVRTFLFIINRRDTCCQAFSPHPVFSFIVRKKRNCRRNRTRRIHGL